MKLKFLNLVYSSAPLTCWAIRVWRVFGTRLINFPRTWGEQRTPGAWKKHPAHPVLFVFAKKLTNFDSRRMVCEPFADSAAQVCSPIHIYAHLVREPFGALVYTRLNSPYRGTAFLTAHAALKIKSTHLSIHTL